MKNLKTGQLAYIAFTYEPAVRTPAPAKAPVVIAFPFCNAMWSAVGERGERITSYGRSSVPVSYSTGQRR